MNRDYLTQQLMATRRQVYDLAGEVRRTKAAVWFYMLMAVIGWALFVAAVVTK